MTLRTERATTAGARTGTRAVGVRAGEVNIERLRAPFSLRCGALLIDYILLIGVVALATLLARMFGIETRRDTSTLLTITYVTIGVVALLNFVLLAGSGGQTLGKWVTGLRVEERDGVPLGYVRAALRHLVGYPLSFLTLGVGLILAAFNREGRALHDFLAGTVVVRARDASRVYNAPPQSSPKN
ncbi:MAG: RDD family protein [Acidobacteria bacterium]|nr:RDD family protein [Acidobacteriota bacterium]